MFKAYFYQRRRGIAVFFLFCGIFAVSFALYRLPLAAVCYPMLLCILAGGVFLFLDFRRVRKKHRALLRLTETETLPPAEGVEEGDYRAAVLSLQERLRDQAAAAGAQYQDMVEYYTLWAHQIKTPIAAMGLTLQNEDTALSRKLRSDLDRIERYVEMVLVFLRLDSPSSDYVFRAHSLDEIVRQAVKKFAPEFIGRKIQLIYEPLPGNIVTDEKWLSFVLEQLLSNALKYTPAGSIRIYLARPNVLCIEDTGIGIAAEDLPRIFEKGYTGCNGRADRKASGIGLYLCKRICGQLGIGLEVRSEAGQGTAVYLDINQYELKP